MSAASPLPDFIGQGRKQFRDPCVRESRDYQEISFSSELAPANIFTVTLSQTGLILEAYALIARSIGLLIAS